MDGHFVPSITFGPLVIETVRSLTSVPLDIHLMIEQPEHLIRTCAEAGGDIITVHVEATKNLNDVIGLVKATGAKAGVALKPDTPLSTIEDLLPDLDVILIMTVNPGFSGQPFLWHVVPKIAQLREMLDRLNLDVDLEVDGGITPDTALAVVNAGGHVLVAGSAVFSNSHGITQSIQDLRNRISNGLIT
jgi:ribulose-phosphate 3-epimerase